MRTFDLLSIMAVAMVGIIFSIVGDYTNSILSFILVVIMMSYLKLKLIG